MGIRRYRPYAPYALALVLLLVLPRLVYPVLALDILLWGLFAVAVDLLLGFGGLLSFGHAAFWGSAGYAAGLAARDGKLAFPLAVLCGVGVALLLALPFGYLSIRRKGIYFAMVTLAFAQMVYYVANEWRPWFRVVALPKYPFMINYVVATNVERFVRFAFGHTSLRSTAPIHGASLGDQSIRRVQYQPDGARS